MVAMSRYMESSPEPRRIGVSGAVSRRLVRPAMAVACASGMSLLVAVVEREVVASRLGIGVNVFQQARTDVEFLRGPRRLGGFLVQAKVGDGLLRHIGLALLLVVIENARRRIEIFGIGDQGGVSIVTKLAQVLRVAQKIEITLHQLRIPERLKTLLVDGQAFRTEPRRYSTMAFAFTGKIWSPGNCLR